jgi:hypothetical protein
VPYNAYNRALQAHPLTTKACTSMVGFILGDLIAQVNTISSCCTAARVHSICRCTTVSRVPTVSAPAAAHGRAGPREHAWPCAAPSKV